MLLLVECNCFVRLKEWFWTESWQHTGWGSFKIRQKYTPPPPLWLGLLWSPLFGFQQH